MIMKKDNITLFFLSHSSRGDPGEGAAEELGLAVRVGPLLDSWVYHIFEGVDVLILTYGSYPTPFAEITHSPEHKAVGLFRPEEVPSLRMPEGYKQSIQTWIGSFSRSHDAMTLINQAAKCAENFLSPLGKRWLHVQGVAQRAHYISQALNPDDATYLVAAA